MKETHKKVKEKREHDMCSANNSMKDAGAVICHSREYMSLLCGAPREELDVVDMLRQHTRYIHKNMFLLWSQKLALGLVASIMKPHHVRG